MKSLSLLTALFCTLSAMAQDSVWSPDSLQGPNQHMERYHTILRYHDPLMYLVYPVVRPGAERLLELEDGEGKKGFWIEGNLAYRFTAYKGKYYSFPLFQRIRLTLDVGLCSRLTRDESSPLLPMNNRFGPGMDVLLTSPESLKKNSKALVWATFQVHHYSNGQKDTFFIPGAIQRNNYMTGDFSTNYFRGMLTMSNNPSEKNSVSLGLGYQQEFEIGGPLRLSDELWSYYGFKRALATFQFLKKPSLVTVNYSNLATAEDDVVKVSVRRQLMYRTEIEYILDDVSKFRSNRKYRLGWRNYLTYMPSITNEVGFMLQTYYGRDYLNIRFDDIILMVSGGLFVRFNAR